jgi:hypothetical protein
MFDRFAAARLKIERAEKHIADLRAIVSALPDTYTSTVEPNEAGGETIKYLAPNVPKISGDMALLIGDAIHNLRVGIEYAYLGAVERHAPAALDCHTKFPARQTEKDVKDALKNRKIDVLSPKLFDRIVSDIKPYEIGGNNLIKYLHDLDVSDKHWLLTPLMNVTVITGIVVQNEKGELERGNTLPIPGDGVFFFDFRPGCKVKDKGRITVEVVFANIDIPLLQNVPVLGDLKDLTKVASYTVERLTNV